MNENMPLLELDLLNKPQQLDAALAFARAHPSLRVVIDHAAKPAIAQSAFEPWATQMARFAAETPVCCKLSGLATEAGAGWDASVLRHFGPERLMWGSDWPVLNLAGDYLQCHAASDQSLAELSAADQARIRGANAAAFYGIK